MKNLKNNWLLISSIVIIILFSTQINANKESSRLIAEKSFKVQSGENLLLKTDLGDVVINSWNKDEILIKIYGNQNAEEKMKFDFNQSGNTVEITANKRNNIFNWFRNYKLKYEINVPNKYNLDVRTAGGDVKIFENYGNINLKTSGGDIDVTQSKGELTAETSGGDIKIDNFIGHSDLSTSGGDISVASQNGNVFASTSGGDIHIIAIDGEIKAQTSGGDISLKYQGANLGVELITSGGDIELSLPSNFSADVKLETLGGEIENNFPNLNITTAKRSLIIGKYNDGGNLLICKTSGGDITVK